MNYHRFESILAASPALPSPPCPSSSASPFGLIQDVTTSDGLPEESASAAYDNDSFQPFRRAHSMRASFTSLRGLRTRLKQPPTVAATKYHQLLSPGRCSAEHHQQHQHQPSSVAPQPPPPTPTLTTTAAALAKANVKARLLRLKETYAEFRRMQSSSSGQATSGAVEKCSANFKIPENMPPKAAAVLLEGGSSARTTAAGRRGVQRTQSLKVAAEGRPAKYGVTIGAGSNSLSKAGKIGGSKLTVRKTVSVPVEREQQKQQEQVAGESGVGDYTADGQCLKVARTATIRRSSVWANSSSSSKIVLD